MKVRLSIIFGIILSALLALTLFTGGGTAGTLVIADVKEVVTKPERYRNRELRVRGHIKPGSVLRYGEKADFILEFEKSELKVRFDGSTQLPDTFADGAPARADGRLNAKGELISNKVEAKCASKYDAKHADKKNSGKYDYGSFKKDQIKTGKKKKRSKTGTTY